METLSMPWVPGEEPIWPIEYLSSYMESRGLTQSEIAPYLGVRRETVNAWLAHRQKFGRDRLLELAMAIPKIEHDFEVTPERMRQYYFKLRYMRGRPTQYGKKPNHPAGLTPGARAKLAAVFENKPSVTVYLDIPPLSPDDQPLWPYEIEERAQSSSAQQPTKATEPYDPFAAIRRDLAK